MPRTARALVDGGYYHIITRGIDRRKLFRYRQDYEVFLGITKKYLIKFNVSLLHYCLMSNHIHFLMKADEAKMLPKCMQGILQVYASYFRKKYCCVGFVFQNRYKSHMITNDSYLLECARYIERNPLRAKITESLSNYPWSSFFYYAEGKGDGIINLINPIYISLSNTKQGCKQQYLAYILQERPYDNIIDKEFRIR